jgi:hypothetical protein
MPLNAVPARYAFWLFLFHREIALAAYMVLVMSAIAFHAQLSRTY